MSARMVPLGAGPEIQVGQTLIVLGRHPDCDIRLPSILVSRRHACLTAIDGEVLVRDLGSSNGTRINGQRIDSGRLKPGDELAIADLRYRLESDKNSVVQLFDPATESGDDGSRLAGLERTQIHDEG